jgi:hypothetical protein
MTNNDTMTAEDMIEAQTNLIGAAKQSSTMPRRCKHGVTTNQRCDECHLYHSRWYQLEIPDRTTTTLVRYVLTDDGPQFSMENISRVRTAWMPGYLEVVDFRPIWATWRAHFDQAVRTIDVDMAHNTGVTVDSYDQGQLMELWARDTTPANAAITMLGRPS